MLFVACVLPSGFSAAESDKKRKAKQRASTTQHKEAAQPFVGGFSSRARENAVNSGDCCGVVLVSCTCPRAHTDTLNRPPAILRKFGAHSRYPLMALSSIFRNEKKKLDPVKTVPEKKGSPSNGSAVPSPLVSGCRWKVGCQTHADFISVQHSIPEVVVRRPSHLPGSTVDSFLVQQSPLSWVQVGQCTIVPGCLLLTPAVPCG